MDGQGNSADAQCPALPALHMPWVHARDAAIVPRGSSAGGLTCSSGVRRRPAGGKASLTYCGLTHDAAHTPRHAHVAWPRVQLEGGRAVAEMLGTAGGYPTMDHAPSASAYLSRRRLP